MQLNPSTRDGGLPNKRPPVSPRFYSSRPTEQSFVWRRYAQHPGRRRHVHGPLQPMLSEPINFWPIAAAVLAVSAMVAPMVMSWAA